MSKLKVRKKALLASILLSKKGLDSVCTRIFAALWAMMIKSSSFEGPKPYLFALNLKKQLHSSPFKIRDLGSNYLNYVALEFRFQWPTLILKTISQQKRQCYFKTPLLEWTFQLSLSIILFLGWSQIERLNYSTGILNAF